MKMMPFQTSQQHVQAAMQVFGPINHITLINDKESQGFNPCAIVYFQNSEHAATALSAGFVLINGG